MSALFGLSAGRPRASSPTDRGAEGMYRGRGGVVLSSRSGVSLWKGNGSGLGVSFCGGVIGKAGHKMCVMTDCTVGAHVGRKAVFPTLDDGSDEAVFIVSNAGGANDVQSVHLSPCVGTLKLGTNLDRYLEERREVLDWETLFNGINARVAGREGQVDEEDFERISRKLDGDLAIGMTPFKKRPKLEVVSPPEEFEDISEFALETAVELGDDFLNDGSLRMAIRSLGAGLQSIGNRADSNRSALRALAYETREELELVDLQLSKLNSLLGKRGQDDGTLSAFEVLRELEEQVERLRNAIQPAIVLAADASEQSESMKREIFDTMQKGCAPLFHLYRLYSTDEHTPGNLLNQRIRKLEAGVLELMSQVNNSGGPVSISLPPSPARTGAQFGFSLSNNNNTDVPSSARNPEVRFTAGGVNEPESMAKLLGMEIQIHELKNQMQANAVTIGGKLFKSRADVKSWLAVHAGASGSYVFFSDIHSVMALKMGVTLDDAAADADFESKVRKNGYAHTEEARVASSFSRSLPSFFGKPTPTEARKLPAVKKPEDWEPKTMGDGARAVLDRGLTAAARELLSSASDFLVGEGLLVAQATIQASVKFMTDLSTWMTREYLELLKRGGSETECWGLISHCVRAVFEDLHEARMPGRGPHMTTADRAASSAWGCFQAQLKMQEFEKMGFGAHPTLSYILNIHLRDHTVSRATFDRLVTRLEAVEAAVKVNTNTIRNTSSKVGEIKKVALKS
ncbi:hypothetical protein MHU86_21975 [Fragilaria crotonensis]|nr:hypothetical protein MHU86_21975 [Fragilaria crotonensis]